MNFPEQYRGKHPLGLPHKSGDDFGWFEIRQGRIKLAIMASAGGPECPWEHVSVSAWDVLQGRGLMPTWPQMCIVKDLFWDESETVVQFHPPKSDYINNAKNCLHLWKFKGEMPRPPTWTVGVKGLNP